MPTPQEMREVIAKYLNCYNSGDADTLVQLFSDNAVVEDPVGKNIYRGRSEVDAFYRQAVRHGTQLKLDGSIRGSHSNAAALALDVQATLPSKKAVRVAVIDVVTFDDRCQIESMKCYWGPDDVAYGE